MYTVLVLDKSSATISDLSPATTYVFRVQALSPEGTPGSYSTEYEFQTLTHGTPPHPPRFLSLPPGGMNRFLGPHLFVFHFPCVPSLMFLWRCRPCSGSPDPEQLHGGDGRRGGRRRGAAHRGGGPAASQTVGNPRRLLAVSSASLKNTGTHAVPRLCSCAPGASLRRSFYSTTCRGFATAGL